MNQTTLKVTPREAASRGELQKLRHSGKIPGIEREHPDIGSP